MQIENEIKILDVDSSAAEKLLRGLGAKHKGALMYRRYVYDVIPKEMGAWIRLRTDGTHTTITYKKSLKDSIDGMKEIEVVVDNFENAHQILELAGHTARGYQENKRINYEYKNCMVSIDSWPLIPTYMEIEGPTADDVSKCLEDLSELVTTETTSLSTQEVYNDYGIDLSSIEILKFE